MMDMLSVNLIDYFPVSLTATLFHEVYGTMSIRGPLFFISYFNVKKSLFDAVKFPLLVVFRN